MIFFGIIPLNTSVYDSLRGYTYLVNLIIYLFIYFASESQRNLL